MSEAANLAILRDVFVLAMLGLGLGLAAYAAMRSYAEHQWHADGNVLSRPYDLGDGAVAITLVAYFGASFFQQPIESAAGGAPVAVTLGSLVFSAVFFLAICGSLVIYMVLFRGLNPAEMFGLRQCTMGRAALQAFIILIVVYLLVQGLTWAFYHVLIGKDMPEDGEQEMVHAYKASKSLLFRAALAVTAVFVAPFTEEFIFRGYVYGVTKRFTDRWFAALFTALIFAVVHHNVNATLPLFLLAVGFAAAYEITGCLLVPMIMHAMFNAWNLVMLNLS